MIQIKYFNINYTRDYTIKTFGQAGYEKAFQALNDKDKKIIEDSYLPNDWFPLDTYVNFMQNALTILNNGDETYVSDAAKYNCKHESKTIFSLILKIATPSFTIKSSPVIMKTFFKNDIAKMGAKVTEVAPKHFLVRATQFETKHRLMEVGIGGWMTQIMEDAGAKNVSVEISHSLRLGDGAVEYTIKWD